MRPHSTSHIAGSLPTLILTAVLGMGLLHASPVAGQEPEGRIVGQVVNAASGAPVAGAQVGIEGLAIRTITGVDGRYLLDRVPSGPQSVRVTLIGYAPKTVTDVAVTADAPTVLNITMEVAAIEIADIQVTAQQERGSVAAALNRQRTANGVVSSITEAEMSRSPDGDAAAAVKRVSGVTVQDSRYVIARGLGERYTTAALNGTRVPSPEPERRMVPLDMFPTGLLESISTTKTFTPDQPGDFSGAQVDIQTRSYPASRRFTISASTGMSSEVVGQTILTAPGTGLEWAALAASDRGVPDVVDGFGNFIGNTPSQQDVNQMVRSFRNAWSPRPTTGSPGGGFSASVGGTDPLFGLRIGYLVSGTYSYSQEAKVDQVRAQALAGTGGETIEVDRFEGSTGGTSVLWGGLANLSTQLGSSSRISLNSMYNRTADNEARMEDGFSENLGQAFQIQRLRYVERSMFSTQLAGEHLFSGHSQFDWSASRSGVTRREPDRSEIVYQKEPGQPARWFNISNEGAVRTFGDLDESSTELTGTYRYSFGGDARRHSIKFGGVYRRTDRDASNRVYSIGAQLGQDDRAMNPEDIFDGRFSEASDAVFRLTPLSQGGSYTAEDRLLAGYAMLEWALSDRLRAVTGLRVERSELDLQAQSTLGDPVGTRPQYTDYLPSLALNWNLRDDHILRFSVSQTLSRPEYRELANVQYREVLGGDNVIGNPGLRRTLIRNADIRYEWYPGPEEAISFALFAKDFEDPIERIFLATSGTRVITYANAESARNYGVELEARKGLGGIHPSLSPLSLFSNVTLMDSEIRIDTEGGSTLGVDRPMVGQSPYVVNLGLTYTGASESTSATVLFNISGERISSAAEAPLPDVYEQPRPVLDLALRFPMRGQVSAKLDLKNLLDSPVEFRQGTVIRESYRTGRTFSFGVSWRP